MSSGVVERSDVPPEDRASTTELSGRNWAEIGLGFASSLAVIALYVVAVWAVVILAQALA